MTVFGPGDLFGRDIPCESGRRHKALAEFEDLVGTLRPGQRAVLRDGDLVLAEHEAGC